MDGAAVNNQATIIPCRRPLRDTESHVRVKYNSFEHCTLLGGFRNYIILSLRLRERERERDRDARGPRKFVTDCKKLARTDSEQLFRKNNPL